MMTSSEAQKVTHLRQPPPSSKTPAPVKQVSVNQLRTQAVTLHKKGKFKEAAQLYHVCLSANPNDAPSWSNLGALLRTLKKQDASIGCYTRALELKPNDAGFLSNLGNVYKDVTRNLDVGTNREAFRTHDTNLASLSSHGC